VCVCVCACVCVCVATDPICSRTPSHTATRFTDLEPVPCGRVLARKALLSSSRPAKVREPSHTHPPSLQPPPLQTHTHHSSARRALAATPAKQATRIETQGPWMGQSAPQMVEAWFWPAVVAGEVLGGWKWPPWAGRRSCSSPQWRRRRRRRRRPKRGRFRRAAAPAPPRSPLLT
jgi:hypothetical protein